jgi:NAD-dependent deacetylase
MRKKRLVVFTGAGISAESGIRTFRDSGGLWEEHKVEEVATFEAWKKNPDLVNEFYNQRRKQVMEAQPNAAHLLFADLQKKFDVHVITQNVDDLHERAGSKKVLHLHGEIMKVRSSVDENLVYAVKNWKLKIGDKCEKGSQLRPHIVWFGEMVHEMEKANRLASAADLFVVIGTSLNVYPAAGILNVVSPYIPTWLVDPGEFHLEYVKELKHIRQTAVKGCDELRNDLLKHC